VKRSLNLQLMAILGCLLYGGSLWAQSCTDIFTDAISSNSNGGRITFQSGAQLIASPDAILDTKNLSDFAGSNVSCNGVSCAKSGSAASANNYNNFSNNNNSVSVTSGGNLSLVPDDYRNITVNNGATLTVSAGDYHLWGNLSVAASGNIIVSGGGTARIYVRGDVAFNSGSQINAAGSVEQLLVYTRGDIAFGAGAAGQGLFYTRNDFDIDSGAQLTGAISGKKIELQNNVSVTYDASVFNGDFSGFCSSPALVDHYAISHAVNFATCEAAPILVSSHDSAHLAVQAGSTITLSTGSGLGDWSVDAAASGILNNGGGNDGVASYSFGTGEQSVQLYLVHTNAVSNLDIDITDGAATDLDGSASEDATLNFVSAALRFYADGVADMIATQLAGKDSDIAPGAQTLTLRAVQTNSDTGACEAAIQGSQTVSFGFECQNPASCVSGANLTLSGISIAANNNGAVTAFTDITLNFDASGSANIDTLNYSDAGLLRLYATTDIPAAAPEPAITLMGQSNAFVSKPAGLCVIATDSASVCAPPYVNPFANCSAFVPAASNFELQISGRGWGGALETNDEHCDNPLTPNFQSVLALDHQLEAPISTVTGALSVNTANIISGGNALISQQFDEVGIIAITASLAVPYINGETIGDSQSATIGRFIPDQFRVNNASVNEACTAFTYLGQPLESMFTLQAVNSNGDITRNYAGSFVRPLQSGSPDFGAIDSASSNDLSLRIDNSAGTIFDWPPLNDSFAGESLVSASLQITRESLGAVDGPYSVILGAQVSDEDGVAISDDLDIDTNTDAVDDFATIGQTLQRYGRLRVENALGSELAQLPVPVKAEYFNGSRFVVNINDNCSQINPLAVTLSDVATGIEEPIVPADTSVAAPALITAVNGGEELILLAAPGNGNYGSLNLLLDVESWLQFDWGSGAVSSPSGRVTFGSYRGDDRVIYRQEVLQ